MWWKMSTIIYFFNCQVLVALNFSYLKRGFLPPSPGCCQKSSSRLLPRMMMKIKKLNSICEHFFLLVARKNFFLYRVVRISRRNGRMKERWKKGWRENLSRTRDKYIHCRSNLRSLCCRFGWWHKFIKQFSLSVYSQRTTTTMSKWGGEKNTESEN